MVFSSSLETMHWIVFGIFRKCFLYWKFSTSRWWFMLNHSNEEVNTCYDRHAKKYLKFWSNFTFDNFNFASTIVHVECNDRNALV